jgi:cardiolipin synthase A/B
MGLFSFVFLSLVAALPAWAFPASFSVSPDNSQQLLLNTVQSAKKTLHVNIYLITTQRIQQAIVDKINAGVTVEMLVETQPFGREIVPPMKRVLDTIQTAMKASGNTKNKLWMMNDRNHSVKRRYVFNHAKYVVVDGIISYISSENFVASGALADPARKGNRGWQVALEDKGTAEDLLAFFREDTVNSDGDASEYDPAFIEVKTTPAPPPPRNNNRTLEPIKGGSGDVRSASFCASPESMKCISDFIRSAKKTLDVQHMSLPLYWSGSTRKENVINPWVQEIVDAARRGLKVRVLVNPSKDEESAPSPGPGRGSEIPPPPYVASETVGYLKELAAKEKLNLEAAITDLETLGLVFVHNKGMVADGNRTFVSSINGSKNSVENNREIAVDLVSRDAADYFGQVFQLDWQTSTAKP